MKEKCDRNCSTCGIDNRSYCAVQMAIANQEILMGLRKQIGEFFNSSVDLTQPVIQPDDSDEDE